jgi:hypothetical protein
LFNYTVSFNNQSNDNLVINGYNRFDELQFFYVIEPNTSAGQVTYQAENFSGHQNFADSVVTRFSNGRGYICDLRENGNASCFLLRNPLLGFEEDFNSLGNNIFEFVITQEDFENAFDLP